MSEGFSMRWLDRLFHLPHHVDPAVVEAAGPVLDAAKAQVEAATFHITPALDQLSAGLEALVDDYLAKAGVAGQVATPAVNMVIDFGAQTAKAVIERRLKTLP